MDVKCDKRSVSCSRLLVLLHVENTLLCMPIMHSDNKAIPLCLLMGYTFRSKVSIIIIIINIVCKIVHSYNDTCAHNDIPSSSWFPADGGW